MSSPIEQIDKPIFIVRSGQAGSTILTWSFRQHPNIIPQEESDWLGLLRSTQPPVISVGLHGEDAE
jgi:hypothetical protein